MQERFRIKDDNKSLYISTVKKTYDYLSSDNIDEIKFGAFLLRMHSIKLARRDDESNEESNIKIDVLIDNGLIPTISKVLSTSNDLDVLFEITWALINLTYFPTTNGFEYLFDFSENTFVDGYKKIILFGDTEIIKNLYSFLINCSSSNENFSRRIFENSDFFKKCIIRFNDFQTGFEERKYATKFFGTITSISYLFSTQQKITLFTIFEYSLNDKNNESSEIEIIIIGLKFLLLNELKIKKNEIDFSSFDNSHKIDKQTTIYNKIIKDKGNYQIFNIIFSGICKYITNNSQSEELMIGEDDNEETIKQKKYLVWKVFQSINLISYNALSFITCFLELSEGDINVLKNLLEKTEILYFFENIYSCLSIRDIKYQIFDILISILHNLSLNEIPNNNTKNSDIKKFLLKESLFGEVIKKSLEDNFLEVRKKVLELINNFLLIKDIDINVFLFKNEIIDFIIKNNLKEEEDCECLYLILNCLINFIRCVNNEKSLILQHKKELFNHLLDIQMMEEFEINPLRFNEEHLELIKQIKAEVEI